MKSSEEGDVMITKEQIEAWHETVHIEEDREFDYGFQTCLDLLWPVVEAAEYVNKNNSEYWGKLFVQESIASLTNKISQSQGTGERE